MNLQRASFMRPLLLCLGDGKPDVVQSICLSATGIRGWMWRIGTCKKGPPHSRWSSASTSGYRSGWTTPWAWLHLSGRTIWPDTCSTWREGMCIPLGIHLLNPCHDHQLYWLHAWIFKEKQTPEIKHYSWICKLVELSHESAVIIFSNIRDLIFDGIYKFWKYICNTLVFGRGFKPLTTCICHERLVLLATEYLTITKLQNCYTHLTSSSTSKSGASYK